MKNEESDGPTEITASITAEEAVKFYKMGFDFLLNHFESFTRSLAEGKCNLNLFGLIEHIKKLDYKNIFYTYATVDNHLFVPAYDKLNNSSVNCMKFLEENDDSSEFDVSGQITLVLSFISLLKAQFYHWNLIFNIALVYMDTSHMIESTNSRVTWNKIDALIPTKIRMASTKPICRNASSRNSFVDITKPAVSDNDSKITQKTTEWDEILRLEFNDESSMICDECNSNVGKLPNFAVNLIEEKSLNLHKTFKKHQKDESSEIICKKPRLCCEIHEDNISLPTESTEPS